jgi:heptosyltransferase-2
MKILIIRLSSIGDILLTTAFIRQTRQTFPDAEIDFVVKKKFSGLIRYNPNIDNLFEYDDSKNIIFSEFVKLFRGCVYDYIFDLHNNFRSIYLRQKISSKKKFHIRKDKLAQTALVKFKWRWYVRLKSIPERYLEVGMRAGIQDDGKGLEIYWSEKLESPVKEHFKKMKIDMTRPAIGIAPGAGYFTKQWPIEYFERLIGHINTGGSFNIIVIGGDNEIELAKQLKHIPNVYNFAGILNILESGIAVSKLKCLISNDSGMMHMATAVNIPVIAIFGSSVKEFGFFPYRAESCVLENKNAKCRPCSHVGKNTCPKGHFMCMRDIQPEEVYKKLMELI